MVLQSTICCWSVCALFHSTASSPYRSFGCGIFFIGSHVLWWGIARYSVYCHFCSKWRVFVRLGDVYYFCVRVRAPTLVFAMHSLGFCFVFGVVFHVSRSVLLLIGRLDIEVKFR
mmetsp:Transcript_73505/g.116434  ORF Transcript_73505/g.116434 Transcript_73505/m.116434 type:complete len:115 (-) Transcript_73505:92-436(-)